MLEYAYSDKERYSTRTAFFRIMATQYGPSISFVSLRHAILAFSAAKLPDEVFRDRHQDHKSKARVALLEKLEHPDNIGDGDVLAGCALSAILFAEVYGTEAIIHANGCQAMLTCLYETAKSSPSSDMLDVFGPYVSDYANFFAAFGSLMERSPANTEPFIRRPTSFQQRVKYWDALNRFGFPSEAPQASGLIEAVGEVFGDMIDMLTCCIRRLALKQMMDDFERDQLVDDFLDQVAAELNDFELQHAVDVLKTYEVHEALYETFQMECLELALTILKEASIMHGIQSADTTSMARAIIYNHRSQVKNVGPAREYYTNPYQRGLVVVGVALPREEIDDCKCPRIHLLTQSEFMGCRRAS